MDLSPYQGLGIFGAAYRLMLENDCHAPGSVDRVLADRSILLCDQTAQFLYSQYTPMRPPYRKGTRPELERVLANLLARGYTEQRQLGCV